MRKSSWAHDTLARSAKLSGWPGLPHLASVSFTPLSPESRTRLSSRRPSWALGEGVALTLNLYAEARSSALQRRPLRRGLATRAQGRFRHASEAEDLLSRISRSSSNSRRLNRPKTMVHAAESGVTFTGPVGPVALCINQLNSWVTISGATGLERDRPPTP